MRNPVVRIPAVALGAAAMIVSGTVVTAPAMVASEVSTAGPAWQACVEAPDFDCAEVRVPLDYNRPKGRQITLAVTRLPATGDKIGSLFFNPGGPGGPGVAALQQLSTFFPAELRERFDLVSWDPRGVGQSTAVQCFDSPEAEARFRGDTPMVPVGRAQQKALIEVNREVAKRCLKRNAALLKHMSTADSARDLDALRAMVGDRRLNYWGISYGTFLGATYANMFPKRVGALTLDGNVRSQPWVTAPRSQKPMLPTFLRQDSFAGADATLEQFLLRCGRAGVAVCPFAAESPKATVAKFDTLARQMRKNPSQKRGGITYSELQDRTANGIYFTFAWLSLAQGLQQVWTDTPVAQTQSLATQRYAGPGQQLGIVCSESPNPSSKQLMATGDTATRRYGVLGPYWTYVTSGCSEWRAEAADPYTGPWDKRTASPILLIGNTYDPATPLSSTRYMHKALKRSRLLIMRGYGHTALVNPSTCINRKVTRYFIDGTLPANGTKCDQDDPPFEG